MKTRELIETDVLCIGGGIAGLMAAIRAGELGAKVVVAEKGNTESSGAGGIGNDHFACYIPEVHGADIKPVIDEMRGGQLVSRLRNAESVRIWMENTFDIVKLWDSWGIPMKYRGGYVFAGHAYPFDSYNCWLKYEGAQQKSVLGKEARKRGAEIMNRVMIFDLLKEGGAFVALGVSTREEKLFLFRAKSVILGTGTLARMYQSLTPAWMANSTRPGTLTGDGRAMAYRAGAELFNLEMLDDHAGPKYFSRSGQATWVGVVRDPQDRPVGPFLTRPDQRYSDMIIEMNKRLFWEYAQSGKGPLFMDCRGISEEDYDFMIHWFRQEGFTALLNHLEEEKIDLRKHAIEWATYGMRGSGGSIRQDMRAETSLKGLFVAGDETTLSISPAAVFGRIAGENAAGYAKGVDCPDVRRVEAQIAEKEALLDEIRGRKAGPDWKEACIAMQQIMNDYAGSVRSETMLDAGLRNIRRLREKARSTLVARDQHQLSRALELLNMLDIGELTFLAARERRETRGRHIRTDYTYTNPSMDKLLIVKQVNGSPVTEWRKQ